MLIKDKKIVSFIFKFEKIVGRKLAIKIKNSIKYMRV